MRENDLTRKLEKIIEDYQKGYETLRGLGPSVTIFGSARFSHENPYYKSAYEFSSKLASKGFSIITGGGGGIMEAANKAAFQIAGVESIGLNIQLEYEQIPNKYTTRSAHFEYFFARKEMLLNHSLAVVVFPGGFGTMDEFFETITLVQTKKIQNISLILFGKEYWNPLFTFMKKTMIEHKTIGVGDLEMIMVSDDQDVIVSQIVKRLNLQINEMENTQLSESEYYCKAKRLNLKKE